MKITSVVPSSSEKTVAVNVVLCWQKSSTPKATKVEAKSTPEILDAIEQAVSEGSFKAEPEQVLNLRGHDDNSDHTLVLGMGAAKSATHETFRRVGAVTFNAIASKKLDSARLRTSTFGSVWIKKLGPAANAFVEGFLLASYSYDECRSEKTSASFKTFEFSSDRATQKTAISKSISQATGVCEGVNFARELGDAPGNVIYPASLAKKTQAVFKNTKVKVTVWDEAKLKKEKMGLLLSVGQGSAEPSRLIIMEYKGAAKSKKPVCFVGKGITFDSGGVSIKPSAAMEEMKYDMCGAASVIGMMVALERTKAKVNAIAIVAAAENMPSGTATKPGDVHYSRSGKSVEIFNTDAEGRLALADALCYASEQKPAFIVDAATLTGAMVIALGTFHTGYFARDEKLAKAIDKSVKETEESAWRMPLDSNHSKQMKGIIADLKNIGNSRGAGSAQGAAFLNEFVDKEIPWAHFDIAGTAWNVGSLYPYCPSRGASGIIVRSFYNLACSYK